MHKNLENKEAAAADALNINNLSFQGRGKSVVMHLLPQHDIPVA